MWRFCLNCRGTVAQATVCWGTSVNPENTMYINFTCFYFPFLCNVYKLQLLISFIFPLHMPFITSFCLYLSVYFREREWIPFTPAFKFDCNHTLRNRYQTPPVIRQNKEMGLFLWKKKGQYKLFLKKWYEVDHCKDNDYVKNREDTLSQRNITGDQYIK